MLHKFGIVYLALFTLVSFAAAKEYTLESLFEAVEPLSAEADVVAVCKDYVENAPDIELSRTAQDYWMKAEYDGLTEYFKGLAEDNPRSGKYAYLYGRILESPLEKIEQGHRVIGMEESWPYGYRLVAGTYFQYLFDGKASAEEAEALKTRLPQDEGVFDKLEDLDPDEDYVLQYQHGLQLYTENYPEALRALQHARDLEQSWASPEEFAVTHAYLRNFTETMSAVRELVDTYLERGWITAEEKEGEIRSEYQRVLRRAEAYEEILRYLKSLENYQENPEILYDLSCTYALFGNPDQAFRHLEQAVEKGWDKVEQIRQDSDFESLHPDPRWDQAVRAAQAAWDAGADERRSETLRSKFEKDAPLWALAGVNGDTVRLADLKGQIIILDFWATWCGPCRQAMPVLDQFIRTAMPEGVHVFSINVWEKNPKKAKLFMEENGYTMTLLYGNKAIAKAYEVKGIPYLCVIDKNGKIRFEAKGYSEGLKEELVWWVNDLM